MMNSSNDSILVFEYFTASGELDPCIISEAETLISSLVNDLKNFSIDLLLNKSFKNLFIENNNLKLIFIEEDLEDWLLENGDNYDRSIFIAAENNMNLYNITKILEDKKVKIYNSSSNASLTCSNKFSTYNKLLNIVSQPKTFKIQIDSERLWINKIKDIFFSLNRKIILKPINGVDCENIKIIGSFDDFGNDLEEIFLNDSYIIVQEYIEGEDVSVSLLSDGKKAVPLSLNKQDILIKNNCGRYLGGQVLFNSEFKEELFKIAVDACESIEGIKGFVGVDLILNNNDSSNENIYLLEINSRFTTPYVGLQKVANYNIGQSIIDLLDGKITIDEINEKISYNGIVDFKKEGLDLKINIK